MKLWTRVKRRPTVWLVVCGLVVHAGVLAMVHQRSGNLDAYAFQSLDGQEFYRIALNLSEHGSFSASEAQPLMPDTWRTPGYPLFLALLMLIGGSSSTWLIVAQQLLRIFNLVIFHKIMTRHMSSNRAILASALFLCEPYGLYYSLWLMSTTWFVTVLLIMWLCWHRYRESRHWPWMIGVGGLTGLLVLIRPVALLIPLLPAIWLIGEHLLTRPRPRPHPGPQPQPVSAKKRPILLPLGVYACSLALVIGSWLVRNHNLAGAWALSDQGGVVLAYFKATEVVLWREGRSQDRYRETALDPQSIHSPHPVWDAIDQRLQAKFPHWPQSDRQKLTWRILAQGNHSADESFAVSAALSDIGVALLLEKPIATLACCLTRCGSILTFPLNLAIRPPRGITINRWAALVKGSLYTLLLVFALLGVLRNRRSGWLVFFPLASALALLLATTPQFDPRFRVPMIPLLLALALAGGRQSIKNPCEDTPESSQDPCIT